MGASYTRAAQERPTGLTAQTGWEIGVRRTLPAGPDELWDILLRQPMLARWSGVAVGRLEAGAELSCDVGTAQVRSLHPGQVVRLARRDPEGRRLSTMQLRLRPATTGTTVAFHEEHLADGAARSARKEHWEAVLQELADQL